MSLRNRTILVTLSNLLQVISGLVISISLARILEEKSDFGKFQQLLIVINFVLSTTSGIPLGLNYFYGRYKQYNQRIKLYARFFSSLTFAAVIGSAFLLFLKDYFNFQFGNEYFVNSSLTITGLLFFKVLNSFFVNFNMLTKNLRWHISISILTTLEILVLIGLGSYLNFSLTSFLYGLLILESFKFLLFSIKLPKYFRLQGYRPMASKVEWLYILPVTGVQLVNILNIYADKYMISAMLDAESYADYQVGAFVFPFVGIITGSVITTMLPVFTEYYRDNKLSSLTSLWKSATIKTSILLLPIFTYSIFFSTELIVFLYSKTYEFSGEIFRIYSFRYLLSVILFGLVMSAIGLEKLVVINSAINLIVNVVLNYFLINQYGVMGAVYATVASTFIGYIIPIYFVNRQLNAKFSDYFPVSPYLKIFFLSNVVAILFRLTFNSVGGNNTWVVLQSLVYYPLVVVLSEKLITKTSIIKDTYLSIKGGLWG